MSLAMYAAPFDNDSNGFKTSDDNYINNKKKQTHNKTQKRNFVENFDTQKVNNVLQKIHDNSTIEDDTLGDFTPPPKPESIGSNKKKETENMQVMNGNNGLQNLGNLPSPNYEDEPELELNNINANYGDNKTVEDYYTKMIPSYNKQNKNLNRQYYANNNYNNNIVESNPNEILLQKLNYMINLLEEQQDEKTNNVTEEVVLYSFLGIFIIFIVDSFARTSRYTR